MTLSLVDAIGEHIERDWSARDYATDAFPSLCVQALADAHLHQRLEPDEIIDWALKAALKAQLPQQVDPAARFGQPPITLFRSRRFFIAALFWIDGTTSIHDHGFSGAFQVLSGSSIETTFRFETTRNVGDHLRLGTLSVEGSRLLRQGDVRPIVAGPTFIHSLFHLPRPAVSLVVRTFLDARPGIQMSYHPPGVALNKFLVDETLERLLQLVDLLRATDAPGFESRVGELIAHSDLHTAFSIIQSCQTLSDKARLGRLIERVRDAEARQLFSTWAAEAERIRFLKTRRAVVHDPDLRFLIAVLLNAHRRRDALELVAAQVPGTPPARQIASWLAGLSTITARLQVAGAPWEPSLLGLPPFTARLEDALTAELQDQPTDVARLSADERAALDKLRALPPLAPLFR